MNVSISEQSNDFIDKFKHHNWFFSQLLPLNHAAVNGGGTTQYTYYRSSGGSVERANSNFAPLSLPLDDDIVDQWAAISDLFNDMIIRGDSTKNPQAFDGLDKIIRKDLRNVWDKPLDLTGLISSNLDQNALWIVRTQLMSRIRDLRPRPTFILGNDDLISALWPLGWRTGTYTATNDESIENIKLIRMASHYLQHPTIPTKKVKSDTLTGGKKPRVDYNGLTYVTQAYVGSFGPDAIQGFTMPDDVNLPMDNRDKRRVKMHIGMAICSDEACGMFTNVYLPEEVIEKPQDLDLTDHLV